ncbi:acetyl-CoA carboxylase biotin carboxylase subunit, partial [Planctomycetota bacterium]
YLVDSEGEFYFMEMNTRLQVEHPVTELVTGVDIVQEQLRIASGLSLRFSQEEVRLVGHAIEARINAEDSDNDFKPCPGAVSLYFPPAGKGVRVDSHVYGGYEIPSAYDSMIGKLIVQREDRAEAVQALRRALQEYVIEGVKTTVPFHLRVLSNHQFRRGQITTSFVEDYFT